MDKFDFADLAEELARWPSPPEREISQTATPLLGRIRQILDAGRSAGSIVSYPDLMVLLRQLLLSRSTEEHTERLRVPRGPEWPDTGIWQEFGFQVTKTGTYFLLEPRPWRPDWLGAAGESTSDLLAPEYQADKLVRRDARVPMDPFLRRVTGFEHYVSPGQREAVLSALLMPKGSSLIVNLPTGSGKTLVAQAPMLVYGPNAGLTLFVVPTNALALDLQRRTRELLAGRAPDHQQHTLAWVGGRTDGSHEDIKQRIRSGTQGILFVSPEAACGALLHALYAAAENGLIAYLVVDEAHLIAQWGDSFRPAFQQISGVRRGLLQASPGDGFRTLLLSATFSPQVTETLQALFGPKEALQSISAVHLRPEPRYLSYRANGWEDKEARVVELLRHIPRPFILYTTKRSDAKGWHKRLREAGYRRIACMHGETPTDQRERVIDDWVNDRIDGVVATSAFGVGMDKGDVRSVIHAALPETLDRFYQEVGRGGRDGRPSLSVTLFDDKDMEVARDLSTPMLIGDERGFERWQTLYQDSEPDPNDPDVRMVDLRKLPGGLYQQSDYNRDWNMRTLILLARAGLIQLESARPAPIERADGEDEVEFEGRTEAEFDAYFSRIPVRTLDPRLLNRDFFDARVNQERNRGTEAANAAFGRMLDALSGRREMSEVLVELFAGGSVVVSPACRGCPSSGGAEHEEADIYQIPPGIGITQLRAHNQAAWRERFSGLDPSMLVVLCPTSAWSDPLATAIKAAIASFGVRELALRTSLRNAQSAFWESLQSPEHLLVLREYEAAPTAPGSLPLARATLLIPWDDQPFPDELQLYDRPLHIVFAPADIGDAQHPERSYRDTARNCIGLQEFLDRATR